jgi:hypothetical protein
MRRSSAFLGNQQGIFYAPPVIKHHNCSNPQEMEVIDTKTYENHV